MKTLRRKMILGLLSSLAIVAMTGCGGDGGGGDNNTTNPVQPDPAQKLKAKDYIIISNKYDPGENACKNLKDDFEFGGFVNPVMYYSSAIELCADFGKKNDYVYCGEQTFTGGVSTHTCAVGYDDHHGSINDFPQLRMKFLGY